MSAEEGNEVAIDFAKDADDFRFEFGRPQRDISAPVLLDGVAFLEKVIQINRNQNEPDKVAENTQKALHAAADVGHEAGGNGLAMGSQPNLDPLGALLRIDKAVFVSEQDHIRSARRDDRRGIRIGNHRKRFHDRRAGRGSHHVGGRNKAEWRIGRRGSTGLGGRCEVGLGWTEFIRDLVNCFEDLASEATYRFHPHVGTGGDETSTLADSGDGDGKEEQEDKKMKGEPH